MNQVGVGADDALVEIVDFAPAVHVTQHVAGDLGERIALAHGIAAAGTRIGRGLRSRLRSRSRGGRLALDLGLDATADPAPVEVVGRIVLAAAGERDVLVAGDPVHGDAMGLNEVGDQVDDRIVLLVGVRIGAVAEVDDLDTDREVVDVALTLELRGAGVPGALGVGNGLHDGAVLADDVMGAHLGRGVLEEVGDVLGRAAGGRVVKDDRVDVGAAGTFVVVRRRHRDDLGLGDAARQDRLDLGHMNQGLGNEFTIRDVITIVEQLMQRLELLRDRISRLGGLESRRDAHQLRTDLHGSSLSRGFPGL
ncbi:hypothetical protein D3C86_747770 [compost metagenome]